MADFVNRFLSEYSDRRIKILDIGSQDINGSYKPLFENPNWEYTGCDIVEGRNVDIVLKNMYNWSEIESDSYDVLVCGQVFEHVEYFWVTIMEIARIIKENGLCCIIAPSAGIEHRYPVDCWRYYPDGFRAMAKYAGLEVLDVYTQWDNVNFPDGSGFWKDSVLICRKPVMSVEQRQLFKYRNTLSKLLAESVNLHVFELKENGNIINYDRELITAVKNIENNVQVEESFKIFDKYDVDMIIEVINAILLKDKVEIFNFLAINYFNAGVINNVLPYLNAAYQIDRKNKDTLYNLGYVLYALGENQSALKFLQMIDEQDEEVFYLINKINSSSLNG